MKGANERREEAENKSKERDLFPGSRKLSPAGLTQGEGLETQR